MRLFVAVIPPDHVLSELAAAVTPLAGLAGADGLRWTPQESWHLTLAFLGEVDDATLPRLTERLARAAHRHPPLTLRLSGGGRFGDRALWAGVAGDVRPLSRLAQSVTAGALRSGIRIDDDHPFRAHLTLARNRATTPLRPYADTLSPFEGTPWTADRFHLVHSRPPLPGIPGAQPHYEPLQGWPLGV